MKIEACPVNAGHYIAFKHHISFATYLAANFGCNQFRIMPDIVSCLQKVHMSNNDELEKILEKINKTIAVSLKRFPIEVHSTNKIDVSKP